MNQNINLYLPEFRRERMWLDPTRMLQWVAGVVFVVALVSAWQMRLQRSREVMLLQAEAESQQLAAQVAELETQLASVAATQTLETEITALQTQLREKQVLLDFLEGRELGNVTGFSEYLADLSRYHMSGLSLTGIVLRGGGTEVALSGQVLEAELVPLYIQNLRKGQAYLGKNFQTLTIGNAAAATNSSANGFLEFEVASGPQTPPAAAPAVVPSAAPAANTAPAAGI